MPTAEDYSKELAKIKAEKEQLIEELRRMVAIRPYIIAISETRRTPAQIQLGLQQDRDILEARLANRLSQLEKATTGADLDLLRRQIEAIEENIAKFPVLTQEDLNMMAVSPQDFNLRGAQIEDRLNYLTDYRIPYLTRLIRRLDQGDPIPIARRRTPAERERDEAEEEARQRPRRGPTDAERLAEEIRRQGPRPPRQDAPYPFFNPNGEDEDEDEDEEEGAGRIGGYLVKPINQNFLPFF